MPGRDCPKYPRQENESNDEDDDEDDDENDDEDANDKENDSVCSGTAQAICSPSS
jgi:hypothetical protein